MIHVLGQFAQADQGGLSALGLNVQSFLFQLITFVIVLIILRVFVYKRLVNTLEARRTAVEKSLKDATQTEERVKETEKKIAAMLEQARGEGDEIVSASQKEATGIVEAAQAKAVQRAEHIVTEAKAQMDVEVAKARTELKKETAKLVAMATEHVIGQKLDASKDAALIQDAVTTASKERTNG